MPKIRVGQRVKYKVGRGFGLATVENIEDGDRVTLNTGTKTVYRRMTFVQPADKNTAG